MYAYHFIGSKYGIEDIEMKRLKVALIKELNDPFEFFSVDLSNIPVRHTFVRMKDELSNSRGLLCFSRSWRNPVQWSHYAEKHQGLCLGFEIPDEKLGIVSYSRRRLVIETEELLDFRGLDYEKVLKKFLFTKYSHWRYENEARMVVNLEEMDLDDKKGIYFAKFSKELRLIQIIVGAESKLTRADIRSALGSFAQDVMVFKARLAFKTFRVVQQKNQKLWA